MNKTVKNGMKVVLLFIVLFLINILVFRVLTLLGFDLNLSETSYLISPLAATILLCSSTKNNPKK